MMRVLRHVGPMHRCANRAARSLRTHSAIG
jgi:hypothetical protein